MTRQLAALIFLLFPFFSAGAQDSAQADPWKITASQIDRSKYYGVTVANGMIGIVSSPEPFKVKDVVLAGTYDQYGRGRVSNFIRSFNLLNMNLSIDGKTMHADNVTGFTQTLDMHHASFTGAFTYGDKASVTYTYYSLRQLPFTVLMEVTVTAKQDLALSAASVMEAPDLLRDVQNYYNEIDKPDNVITLLTSSAKSPTGKLLMCASTTFLFDDPKDRAMKLIHEMWDNNMHSVKFDRRLKAGETWRFSIAGSSVTSAHHDDPLNEAERLTVFARLEGHDRLLAAHNRAWDSLWTSDIRVTGDPQSQQDIHNMMYHLYSFSRAGTSLSPSPMGLSGLGYNGHVFWDTELWMFPVLLVLHPEIAKSMLEYRYERLEAARKNAFALGYRGAMYPWESAGSGVEETPVWALSGPFEQHITACVALAAWNYYKVTRDKDWLRDRGWPIISATADFWASRAERNGPGHFELKNVVASDEWAENVDNDAFTNAAAKANLAAAAEAGKMLGMKVDPDWDLVRRNIPILTFPDGVTREHAAYHGEPIKQADVNLLAYPLHEITDRGQIRKDLDYYEQKAGTEGTPAMMPAILSLLHSRMGDGAVAIKLFKDSYLPNLQPPFRVMAETRGGENPYFATGAGGVLQAVLMGFSGLEITPAGLTQLPVRLPPGWTGIEVTGTGPDRKNYRVR